MQKTWFKEFHPIVYTIILGSVFMNIGFGMVIPFFAIYLSTYTGFNPVFIGFIVGATAVGSMLGGFLGGTLSDQYGRKYIMLLSLVSASIVYAGFMLHSYPMLLVILTLIMGFCTSFFDPCAKALMADFTESKKRLRAFSLRYIGVNIGFAIGPLLGVVLGITTSSRLPFLLASIILLVYAFVLYRLFIIFHIQEISIPEKERVNMLGSLRAVRKDRILLFFLFGGLLATTVHGQFSVILSQYFELEWKSGLAYLMLLWSVHSLVIVMLGLPIVKIMERLTSFRAILCGSTFFALGILGFAFSYDFLTFCLAMIIFTIGEILLIPAEYSIIDEITPEQIRGTYYGTINFTAIGSFIGPWISGILLVNYGGLIMFVVLAFICIVSILFFYLGHRRRNTYRIKHSTHQTEAGL